MLAIAFKISKSGPNTYMYYQPLAMIVDVIFFISVQCINLKVAHTIQSPNFVFIKTLSYGKSNNTRDLKKYYSCFPLMKIKENL